MAVIVDVGVTATVGVAVHVNGTAPVIGPENLPESDPLRRLAQSVPQNIAEGAGRMTQADKARHYTIARGSAMESAAHLDVLKIGGIIDEQQYCRGIELLERVVAMLTKLVNP